eukprot:GHVH01009256.1.p1 GENE.GHVH01009256.1~~GHVH01009256.1.p1  ORF type:complete len:127 (+),score=4.18 GHVH01009256.1:35-382(+)
MYSTRTGMQKGKIDGALLYYGETFGRCACSIKLASKPDVEGTGVEEPVARQVIAEAETCAMLRFLVPIKRLAEILSRSIRKNFLFVDGYNGNKISYDYLTKVISILPYVYNFRTK